MTASAPGNRLARYLADPHFWLDAAGFALTAALPLVFSSVFPRLPLGWTERADVYVGEVCRSYCALVYVNSYGAVLPVALSLVALPLGGGLFFRGSPRSVRVTAALALPAIAVLAGLGQRLETGPFGEGLTFNPLLAVLSLLLFMPVMFRSSREMGVLGGSEGWRQRAAGGALFAFGFWVLVAVWNDVAGLFWFLRNTSYPAPVQVAVGGLGGADGIVVVPLGVTAGYLLWVLAARRWGDAMVERLGGAGEGRPKDISTELGTPPS